MSLLLDALKKAALEKQRREQHNSAKAPAPEPQAPTAPNEAVPAIAEEVVGSNSNSVSSHDLGALNPHAFDEIPVNPLTREGTPTEPLSPEPNSPDSSVEHQREGLVFDINEIDQQYLLPAEKADEPAIIPEKTVEVAEEESIVDGFVRKASTLVAPANSSPLSMAPKPDSKTEESAQAKSPEEVKTELPDSPSPTTQPVDVPSTSAPMAVVSDDVETFNAASGKAALAQLLDRSKKAAGAARKRMVLMYGILSVIAVVLVVFYYYLLHSSSTLVAALPPAAPAAEIPVSGEIAEVTPVTEAESGTPPLTPDEVGTVQASLVAQEDSSLPQAESNTWPEESSEKNSARATRKQAQQTEDDYSANSASLPPERGIKQAMIVEHNAEQHAVSEAIARGYKAYQTGDLEGAGAAYREALEQDPYQRDALLGAAAVAVREGRPMDALTLYQKRLAREPKDEYAQAGILALSSSAEQNSQLESELTRLLLEYPDAAHLHFLKGSLYAARQQWAAAQLAFFEAWQRDNKNPDLAFNLAVALDHLSQPKEAVRFYRQAIDLGNKRPVGFSVDAILRRLQVLEQQHVQEGATQ